MSKTDPRNGGGSAAPPLVRKTLSITQRHAAALEALATKRQINESDAARRVFDFWIDSEEEASEAKKNGVAGVLKRTLSPGKKRRRNAQNAKAA